MYRKSFPERHPVLLGVGILHRRVLAAIPDPPTTNVTSSRPANGRLSRRTPTTNTTCGPWGMRVASTGNTRPDGGHARVCIAIVAHHARADQAHDLQDQVGAQYLHMDDGTLGCDQSHRKAWSYLSGTKSDWAVCLEDDALPVDGFRDQLERALIHAPGPVVSLYLGQGRPQHWQPRIDLARQAANRVDASWLIGPALLHAVGVAIRTDLLSSVLLDNRYPIDEALTGWVRREELKVAYTWPSLVDHDDGPTLVDHADGVRRDQRRVAWWCHTRDRWTDRAVKL